MANLVKTKTGIITGSFLVILIISAFETNLFKSAEIKKWNKNALLEWKDFQGLVPPFSSYGAVISSQLYLEYDSLKGSSRAYAGQNNNRSWKRGEMTTSEYGLRHEQYHFNITETFARKFNRHIEEFSGLSSSFLHKRLNDYHRDLSELQDQYDEETDHSLKEDFQAYWEYKIDSMLIRYEENQGTFCDPYSGISGKFPYPPDYTLLKDTFDLRTGYCLERYNMRFRFLTAFDAHNDTSSLEKNFVAFLQSNNFVNIKSNKSTYNDMLLLETECEDTVQKKVFYDNIYYKYPYERQVTVCIPSEYKDNILYNKMKSSFLSTIEIMPREQYWIEKYEKNPMEMKPLKKPKAKPNQESYAILCSLDYSDFSVFYHLPFLYKESVLLPFSIAKHTIEEVKEVLVLVNSKDFYTQNIDSTNQIVKIDTSFLKEGKNRIQFGYTIKADSAAECYHFYSSITEYEFIP